MQPSHYFLLDEGQGRLSEETQLVEQTLKARGVSHSRFLRKQLARRQVALGADTVVIGDVPTVEAALRQIGVEPPECACYPNALMRFLRRRVWATTFEMVSNHVDAGSATVFVKPRGRIKQFTGFVCARSDQLARLGNVSRHSPVWCAEVVAWRAEFRVFVRHGSIVGIRQYDGDESITLDIDVVHDAVQSWTATGDAAAAYAIDFGVLDDGQTALVELNDGYALGAYGLSGDVYTDVLTDRWLELAFKPPASSP